MPKRACTGITKAGIACRFPAWGTADFCLGHDASPEALAIKCGPRSRIPIVKSKHMGKKYPRTVNGVLSALLDFIFDEKLDESGAKILSAKARAAAVALTAIEMISANDAKLEPQKESQLIPVRTIRVLPRIEVKPAEIVTPATGT